MLLARPLSLAPAPSCSPRASCSMEQGFDVEGALRRLTTTPRRVALYAGGSGLLALGANFMGGTSALLSLAPAPSRSARLDLVYPVAGFKRCVDPEGGRYSFIYPARLLADQRLYRQRALLQRERLDDPLLERSALDSERRGRRAAGLPLPLTPSLSVAAFGNGAPRGFSLGAEENLSMVVGTLPAGATLLSAFGEPAEAADKLLRLTRGGTAALVDAHAVRSRARSRASPGPSPNPSPNPNANTNPNPNPNPNPNQARSASGALLYLIEYTVGVDAPGVPEPVHVLCALAAGGAQLKGSEAQQLFTLTYRAPVSRWTTSEADVRQTMRRLR